ncbi:MAG: hypothetical protein M3141_03770 [Actinomycetota bacterium]|nr:hypothetical protein [Actinomycetota bacterium]
MYVLELIDAIDDLAHEAKPVPLSDRVRVDRAELESLIGALREEVARFRRSHDALALVGELETIVREAGPIPLTGRIRVEREVVYAILDRLRVTIPELVRETP